jgi:hypothetical protein
MTIAVSILSFVIVLAVGAACLRAAISIYDRLVGGVGSPRAVPVVAQEKAMGVLLVTAFLNTLVTLLIGLVKGVGVKAAAASVVSDDPTALLVALPTGLLILAGTLTAALPTRFSRALLVVLVDLLIAVVVGILFVAVLVLISLLPHRW